MQVNISGLHMDLGESLQKYVKENIVSKVQKYFDHPTHADVRFNKHGHSFHVEILVNDGTGTGNKSLSKAHADNEDVYKAFDECLSKIAWQLNKYKDKLTDLHRRRISAERHMIEAMDYTINSSDDVEDEAQEQQVLESNPVVIAENKMHIERMSVKDAVMQLELMNLSALAFINDGSGRINFVYTRPDGNISWIDAEKLKMER